MNQSDSIANLAAALANAQGEIEGVSKDSTGQVGKTVYRYADLSNVVEAIKAVASKNGLSWVQGPVTIPYEESGPEQVGQDFQTVTRTRTAVGVETQLLHSSGEWMRFAPFYFPIVQQTAQGAGSAITYARRYSLSAIFGVVPEDDDGAEASRNSQRNEPPAYSWNQFDLAKSMEAHGKLISADFEVLQPGRPVTRENLILVVQEWLSTHVGATVDTVCAEVQKRKTGEIPEGDHA